VSDNLHLIHPEHPFSEPRIARSGKSAIRPSGGLFSKRRAHGGEQRDHRRLSYGNANERLGVADDAY
jgi:hypothetical protein